MKKILASLALAAFPLAAHADDALIARQDVQDYIHTTAQEQGMDEAELTQLFARVQPKPHILDILDRPSTGRPWYEFRNNFINPRNINAGVAFWRNNEKTLTEISSTYQVDPAVIVAILDIETLFGKNTGSFRVLDVLSTTAFDYPRRADFFRKELTEFLLLARAEKLDPFSFKGSYAGAMGWPQFMPSSFRAYAIDWDHDGHHDIWNNAGDAMASVASYLALHGWKADGASFAPVNVESDKLDELVADKFNLHYSVAELMKMGVQPITELDTNQAAVLYVLETSPGEMKYYLGFNNFYTITRYNKSTLYATAVLQLADAIRSAKAKPASRIETKTPPKPAKTAKPS